MFFSSIISKENKIDLAKASSTALFSNLLFEFDTYLVLGCIRKILFPLFVKNTNLELPNCPLSKPKSLFPIPRLNELIYKNS